MEFDVGFLRTDEIQAEIGLASRHGGERRIGVDIDDAHADARKLGVEVAQYVGQKVITAEGKQAIVTSPSCVGAPSPMLSSECSSWSSSERALCAKSRPTAVRLTRRVVRSNSRTPSATSSFATRRLSAGCDRWMESAAARKFISSATGDEGLKVGKIEAHVGALGGRRRGASSSRHINT